jgi:hypothetical protein
MKRGSDHSLLAMPTISMFYGIIVALMYEDNGGGAVTDLLDVVAVKACDGYMLELVFENGQRRRFDMKPLLGKKPFSRLKDTGAFWGAHIDYGTVVWPGRIDIAPETLYDRSSPMD